jgi:NADH dehydrogenase (ubiquinone) 1 beta subcomplex subunit 10
MNRVETSQQRAHQNTEQQQQQQQRTNEQKRMPQTTTTTKAFAGEAASFPSSPPASFDKSNPYEDPVAFVQQREHDTRERMIDVEKAKLIRERLRECYRNEGVNHFENCKDLVEKYTEAFEGKSFARINIMRDSK